MGYAGWREAPNQNWRFAASNSHGGSVSVFGAKHLRDPSDEQFSQIAAAFASARPTAAFYEGPNRGLAATADEAIRTQGESGYLRFLASQAGLQAQSLEPPPGDLLRSLSRQFGDDQVLLFFVLRETARLRDREHLSGEKLDAAVTAMLGKAVPLAQGSGLKSSIRDLASLASAAHRYWPAIDWQALPSDWFSPGEGPAEALFLPAINTAVSEARDLHMMRLFAAAASKGERVFVVVGRNHVPMIAPALECALRG